MRDLFHLIPNALNDSEIAEILRKAEDVPAQDGTIFSTQDNASSIRKSSIKWLSDEALKQRLWSFVCTANQQAFDVDVACEADLQFTSYYGDHAGHYDWHQDVHFASQEAQDRKISVTIQLSAQADYSGGDFLFEDVQSSANFKAKGTALLFPSYLRHKVTPVTSGVRHALVAWFFGPRWR